MNSTGAMLIVKADHNVTVRSKHVRSQIASAAYCGVSQREERGGSCSNILSPGSPQ